MARQMSRKVTEVLGPIPTIVAGLEAFADLVSGPLFERLAVYLEDGVEHVRLLQKLLARMIEDEGRRLETAEKACRESQRRESRIRGRRDEASEELYRVLLQVRGLFEAFGVGASTAFIGLAPGMKKTAPRLLLRHGKEAVDVLSAPGFRPPDGASAEHLRSYAGKIRPALRALDGLVRELEAQKRETQQALQEKGERLPSCKEAVTYGARMSEALYVLAGERFLAERLRPKQGRGSDTAAPEPDGDGPSPGDVAEGSSGSATPPLLGGHRGPDFGVGQVGEGIADQNDVIPRVARHRRRPRDGPRPRRATPDWLPARNRPHAGTSPEGGPLRGD